MQYTLKVVAFDGLFEDQCDVEIRILNVNDNPPVFLDFQKEITIREEELVPGCLITVKLLEITIFLVLFKNVSDQRVLMAPRLRIRQVKAYDPDINERSAPQNIVYSVISEHLRKFFTIDKEGCLSLIKVSERFTNGNIQRANFYVNVSLFTSFVWFLRSLWIANHPTVMKNGRFMSKPAIMEAKAIIKTVYFLPSN